MVGVGGGPVTAATAGEGERSDDARTVDGSCGSRARAAAAGDNDCGRRVASAAANKAEAVDHTSARDCGGNVGAATGAAGDGDGGCAGISCAAADEIDPSDDAASDRRCCPSARATAPADRDNWQRVVGATGAGSEAAERTAGDKSPGSRTRACAAASDANRGRRSIAGAGRRYDEADQFAAGDDRRRGRLGPAGDIGRA